MRRSFRVLTVFAVAAGTLAFAATASAAKVTMKGSVKGDANSHVTLKVKVNSAGTPTKLKLVKFAGLDLFAENPDGTLGASCGSEASGKFTEFVFHRGPAPSIYSWVGHKGANGLIQQTTGYMPYMKPKSATGSVAFQQADNSYCKSRDFKLTKR